jgi:hypothetical protein
MLLVEVLTRISGQRLTELSNADNSGGLRLTQLGGTVTVTSGSLNVVGIGTTFTAFQGAVNTFGGIAIQFSSQPGVSYVVASVTDDTNLVLAYPYAAPTAVGAASYLPGINYQTLQAACFDAQQHFITATNFAFDDVTQSANNVGANPTLNKCVWAGVALVVAYLYDPGRGHPWPEAEVEAAWRVANKRLDFVKHNYGDGAFSPPVTDSVFNPSVGPSRLPTFDNQRWGDISPQPPGPWTPSAGSGGDWGN